MRAIAACFGSVSGASRYDRSWLRLRARYTSGLMANKRYQRVVQKAGVKPGQRDSRNTDEVTGGLRLCAPHPFLDKSGDSRPGKHSH
jgi:hypothetical protein